MATTGFSATEAALIVAASHGGTAVTFAGPIKLLFNTTQRTADNGADTEFTTSGGYTAGTGFSGLTFAAASTGATGGIQASNVLATIANMPAGTWQGCTEKDSSGTPKLMFWGTLASSKTVNLGDTVSVPSGSLTDTLG
jgi:hypothetical protein